MLSDRDRERLREIQRRLVTEDPDFVREFATRPRQPVPRERYPDGVTLCLVGAISLSLLMLLGGWLLAALTLAICAWLISAAQRRLDDDDYHRSRDADPAARVRGLRRRT